MAKKKRGRPPKKKPTLKVVKTPEPPPEPEPAPVCRDRIVPWFKQCPSCYPGHGGVGIQSGKSRQKSVVYYRCDQCGWTWSLPRSKIEGPPLTNMAHPNVKHREVRLNMRDHPGISDNSGLG